MATDLLHPADLAPVAPARPAALAHVTPNWFAAVMGTGIVANAASSLPLQLPGQRAFAVVVWLFAALLLVAAVAATAAHWVLQPDRARTYLGDPVMGHFYGAPPMALLTVGAGALLVGRDLIGLHAALAVDGVFWTLGTLLGLVLAVVVPVVARRRGTYAPHAAFGGWLMPVVAPMVSATTGAFLLPYVPAGTARETLMVACYAMFVGSLAASLPFIALVHRRLRTHGVGAAAAVPTLWIVLGPLGQSATAVNVLSVSAGSHQHARQVFGIVYGTVAVIAALAWLARVATVTLRTAARHLPFSLTWWGFTFPVGTCATGAGALHARTGFAPFATVAVALFAFLVLAWAVVLTRTVPLLRHPAATNA